MTATLLGAQAQSFAQEPLGNKGNYEISINLHDFCTEEESLKHPKDDECKIEPPSKPLTALNTLTHLPIQKDKQETCAQMKELLAADPTHPVEVAQTDKVGNRWKIKFYFGPSRTFYGPTDVHIQSSKVNVVIKDFTFQERTSLSAYDPRTWQNIMNAYQWIDEPTNRFVLKFEKGKDAFFVSVYHPKFLTVQDGQNPTKAFVQGTVDGQPVSGVKTIGGPADDPNSLPIRIQNTHHQVDWQIGYEHQFDILKTPKSKLTYTPHVAAGLTSGQTLTSYKSEEIEATDGVYGPNASVGGTLEYGRGRVNVFLEHSTTLEKLKHPFLDGTADYTQNYTAITVGLTVNLSKHH